MPNLPTPPEERTVNTPSASEFTLRQNRLKAEAAAMSFLAGRAAERVFWSACGPYGLAVHEAAHCVAHYFTGTNATHVSIIPPDAATAGYVLTGAKDYQSCIPVPRRSFLTSDQRCALLMLYLGDPAANWKKLLARMRIVRRRADEFVRFHSSEISALADCLLVQKEMGATEISGAIESAQQAAGRARLRELGISASL